jgi:DNA-binding Lrp family transcriptional regulator
MDQVSKNVPLSENDARVLGILQAQGRRSYADLGGDLGMAAPSVHERVKKLESRGVIRGYAASVDPAAVGLSVLAFTWVTQAPGTISVDLTPDPALPGILVRASVKVTGQTGVEMEALTAVSVACLTVYDMVKAAERGMQIENIHLVEKTGGKSGPYRATP